MLPALSSISTRSEMQPLQSLLCSSFETLAVDWPGFGDRGRPRIDWRPSLYDEFLRYLFGEVVSESYAVIAAGHAASYVVKHFAEHGPVSERLVLLSPTWRGPLPTMMRGDRPMFAKLAKVFDPPVIGPLLYRLNINRMVIGMMARGHVYGDALWLNKERMHEKLRVTRNSGARHASARFVTGRLDPFRSRSELLSALERIDVPVLSLFSEQAPPKSRLEMEAMAGAANVTTVRIPAGKLSFYEERPGDAAYAIKPFLDPAVGYHGAAVARG
jgi:pimeloyl-ACP methyl ester carboxylesterase